MKLGEFIKNFSHNNIVRLHYRIKGGNQCVLDDWNDVSEVLGMTTILFHPGSGIHYPEALNIVIEKLENQPFIEEVVEESHHMESCG